MNSSSRLIRLSNRPNRSRQSGFSLIEILVVIALIAMLVGLVIFNVESIFGSNQESIAATFVQSTLRVPLTQYQFHVGSYPSTEEGLRALVRPPAGKEGRWRGPYIDKLPDDPWGRPYQYRYPGVRNPNGYDLWSQGPNPENSESHIGNWSQ